MESPEPTGLELPKEEKKKLLREALGVAVTIQVGKLGITPGLVSELKKQLEKRGLVKVRILKNYLQDRDRFQVAQGLAAKAGAVLVEVKGMVATYYKHNIRNSSEENNKR